MFAFEMVSVMPQTDLLAHSLFVSVLGGGETVVRVLTIGVIPTIVEKKMAGLIRANVAGSKPATALSLPTHAGMTASPNVSMKLCATFSDFLCLALSGS